MKFSIAVSSLLAVVSLDFVKAECEQPVLPFSDMCGLKIEKVGQVPAINTDPFSYNMNAFDNFSGDCIFFVDQNNGIIYSHKGGSTVSEVTKVFDIAEDEVPAGLTLDWVGNGIGAGFSYRVKAMTQGPTDDSVIVVFGSSTLPDGWTESDAPLPAPGAIPKWVCSDDKLTYIEDIYRIGEIPECADLGYPGTTFTSYDSFYKFTVVDGKLTDPIPFFVSEAQVTPGHLGGGIMTLPDGQILWATGDCTTFGLDGSYPPQLDSESCGKIIKIDPSKKGSWKVAAKGVRNSQQMRCFEQDAPEEERRGLKLKEERPHVRALKQSKSRKAVKAGKATKGKKMVVSFMDIGGVTAEEVNAFPIEALDNEEPLNFGWGRSLVDGKAREGTFHINHGKAFVLGSEPSCAADAPLGEEGYVQPWVQFGRNGFDFFFGISSMAIPFPENGGMLKLIWTEFNTGKMLGTPGAFVEGAPPTEAFKLKIFDETGAEFDGLNGFVEAEFGAENVGFTTRGDGRLFHFPDGQIGVLIERTGVFYKVTEIML